jgi:hypothetical protein
MNKLTKKRRPDRDSQASSRGLDCEESKASFLDRCRPEGSWVRVHQEDFDNPTFKWAAFVDFEASLDFDALVEIDRANAHPFLAASDLIGGHSAEAGKAISALEQAGVPADKALPFATGFFEKVKEIVGPDAINQLAANVPALQTFLAGEK